MLVILFWLLWFFMLIFGVGGWRTSPNDHWGGGYSIVVWLLIGILGYKLFGSPLH